MPRYYFHLRHPGKRVMDCAGVMLANPGAAREEAMLTVRDFFCPGLNVVDPAWADCSLEVRDTRGCLVADIAFAEAASLAGEHAAKPGERSSAPNVVFLDIARARREFAAVESRARELLQHTHILVERQRRAAEHLSQELQVMNRLRSSSHELVARARQQSSANQAHREVVLA